MTANESGSCGENVTWTLYDSVLTTSWSDYKDEIRSLVIEEGVTELPVGAFYGRKTVNEQISH